nr:MAG TPA: hypothetical protein [Herelleviridae sp.]
MYCTIKQKSLLIIGGWKNFSKERRVIYLRPSVCIYQTKV